MNSLIEELAAQAWEFSETLPGTKKRQVEWRVYFKSISYHGFTGLKIEDDIGLMLEASVKSSNGDPVYDRHACYPLPLDKNRKLTPWNQFIHHGVTMNKSNKKNKITHVPAEVQKKFLEMADFFIRAEKMMAFI